MMQLNTIHALDGQYDLIVIGAGPAGLSAAIVAAEQGLRVLLLDENASIGGQIYRGIESTTRKRLGILGADYAKGAELARQFIGSQAVYLSKSSVWRITRQGEVGISRHGEARIVGASRILVATGAMERPFPILGWTLPGVMTAGAAQILLKASGATLGPNVVLAGSGPLLWLIASQYLDAGVPIKAILDTTPRANVYRAISSLPSFVLSPYFAKGLGLMAKVRRQVRFFSNVEMIEAQGEAQVERVRFHASGKEHFLPTDHVLLHQGVVPEVSLLRAAGCELEWDDLQMCWRPVVDGTGMTTVPWLYVAGDGAAIAGAEVASLSGRRAGLEIARSLDRISAPLLRSALAQIDNKIAPFMRGRAFLDRLYTPRKAHLTAADAALACRCEEVRGDEVRNVVAQLRVLGPNQLKAFLRCGMGPCQGRQCGLGVTTMIAEINNLPPRDVGTYRLRPPVKPISVEEIANLKTALSKGE